MAKLRPLERLFQKMTLISSSSTHLQTIPDDDSTVFLLLLLALSPSKFGSKIPAPVSQQALSLLVCKKNTSAHSGGTSLAPHIRALITLFGRIVRRLWKLPVATIFQDHSRSVKGKKERIFFDNLLRVIQDDLVQLRSFLSTYFIFLYSMVGIGY